MPRPARSAAGLDRERDLGAGRDQDDVGAPVGVRQHVAAVPHVVGAGEDGQGLAGEQQRGRPAARHRHAPGGGRLVGVRGPDHVSRGIARSEAACSIGWWVGPSSPTPMLSWVKT